jgi:hypothetical protein
MLEMVGLESVGGTNLLRVRAEFSNECIIFDREIRPLREGKHRSPNCPVAELLDLIPPFTFVPRKQIFSRLFDILSLQLLFPQVGWCYCHVVSGAD